MKKYKLLKTISEWYDNQEKLKGDLRKLLQEQIEKTNLSRQELKNNEEKRLGINSCMIKAWRKRAKFLATNFTFTCLK